MKLTEEQVQTWTRKAHDAEIPESLDAWEEAPRLWIPCAVVLALLEEVREGRTVVEIEKGYATPRAAVLVACPRCGYGLYAIAEQHCCDNCGVRLHWKETA